ncbi:hypothetical protein ACHHYP_07203 [Achlya hypogyna]|uniref:Uncharacterized protein n=1 Tax=Achlya hypogyna TaxID=1202772 RepID=A0A1V9ZMM7_ACHHY|nr:hypothetical protein ACHHYP_07203 [Achlya hypogyna]
MLRVLHCPVLLREICGFQNGLFEDLRPLFLEWRTMQNAYGNIVRIPPRYERFAHPYEIATRPLVYASFNYLRLAPRSPDPRFLVYMAVVAGDLALLQRWLRCIDAPMARLLELAARFGHLHILEYILKHLARKRDDVRHLLLLDVAAEHGHLAIVDYLHANGIGGCSIDAMDAAATNGHLAIVEYLGSHRREGCSAAALEGAACHGHEAVVRYLLHHHPQTSRFALDVALLNGHHTIAKLLREASHVRVCEKYAFVG